MPAIYSLIQDMFPAKMRSRANSIISCGNDIGDGIASLYIIFIAKFGWRAAITNMGMVGMMIGLSVLAFIKEPKRGQYS
jgi:sugar phosphate permease